MATKEAQRDYQRQWIAKRRADWFAENGPCVDCGSVDDLQLDHVNAEEKIHHAVWSWSALRRLPELAKCVVRCRPCHVNKTAAMNEYDFGEVAHNAKATTAEVKEILRRVGDGEKQITVARSLGLSKQYVSAVVLRTSRKYGV